MTEKELKELTNKVKNEFGVSGKEIKEFMENKYRRVKNGSDERLCDMGSMSVGERLSRP